ncbi:GAF domain-containing sensor histidine kinase [Salinicola peritrichatus]|uniref:GAF domain-containing sensor histidine kinase n=1 Tax=Salinicola peritrichatus TaxID=1267424 RepID=UPI0019550D1C|nr:ATP-binding protein [Salinicola peritrichatus]
MITETLPPSDEQMREKVLMRIPALLAEQCEIQAALEAMTEQLGQFIPFTHADVCLLDTPGWAVSYEVGISTYWSERRTRVDCAPIRDVLQGTTRLMVSGDAVTDPRQIFPGACNEPILQHHLRSRISVALYSMGQVIGALSISHRDAERYDTACVALVCRLAELVAPTFLALHIAGNLRQISRIRAENHAREEGLRQGSLQLTQALEWERQRIGMDLHDQTLADLTRLRRELESGEAPPSREMLDQRLARCIDDLRCIIDMTAPKLLELFGFLHAVRDHLERATEGDGIDIEIVDTTDGAPDRLAETTRTALYRIVQEAINNATRHAHAERIEVRVAHDPSGALHIVVHDNGRGLCGARGRQSGMLHMRTRAQLIGAELDIFDQDGTCVAITLRCDEGGAKT